MSSIGLKEHYNFTDNWRELKSLMRARKKWIRTNLVYIDYKEFVRLNVTAR